MRQLAFALAPLRTIDHLVDALRQAITLHAQSIHRDARRLQQIATPNLGRVHIQLQRELIQLRLESKANIHGPMSAHGAADGLIGEHAISVVLNIGDVVQRAQQRTRIENGDHAIGAVSAAILHDACFHGGDVAIFVDAEFSDRR